MTKKQRLTNSTTSWTGANTLRLILVIFFNFLLPAWLWLALFITLFSLLVTTIATTVCGIAVIIAPILKLIFPTYVNMVFLPIPIYWSVGTTIFLISLLFFLLIFSFSILVFRLFQQYLKLNLNFIKKV